MVQDASRRWVSVLMADLEPSFDVFDTLMPRNTVPPLLCTLGCRGVEFGDGESFLFICVSFREQEQQFRSGSAKVVLHILGVGLVLEIHTFAYTNMFLHML